MLKVGDRIIFDVTGNNTVKPADLRKRLAPYDFLMWVRHDGCEAEITQILDDIDGYYNIQFNDALVLFAVSKIHFEDLIEEEEEIVLTDEQRGVVIELLMREHTDICSDDFREVTSILLNGFPGYEKMSGVELIEDLTDQGLHPEYIRRTVDLEVGDKVQVVGGVNNDRDLGFEKIFKDAIGKVSEINEDRPTPISVDCEKIGRHDSFWRTELELLGKVNTDELSNSV